MNPDVPIPPRDEQEARLTALLLGELPPPEAAALRQALAQDAALALLHDRLKQTIDLVREAVSHPEPAAPASAAPCQLSEDRRQKLLAQFKTVVPKEFVRPRRARISWFVPLSAAAALVGLLALVRVLVSPSAREAFLGEDFLALASQKPVRPTAIPGLSADYLGLDLAGLPPSATEVPAASAVSSVPSASSVPSLAYSVSSSGAAPRGGAAEARARYSRKPIPSTVAGKENLVFDANGSALAWGESTEARKSFAGAPIYLPTPTATEKAGEVRDFGVISGVRDLAAAAGAEKAAALRDSDGDRLSAGYAFQRDAGTARAETRGGGVAGAIFPIKEEQSDFKVLVGGVGRGGGSFGGGAGGGLGSMGDAGMAGRFSGGTDASQGLARGRAAAEPVQSGPMPARGGGGGGRGGYGSAGYGGMSPGWYAGLGLSGGGGLNGRQPAATVKAEPTGAGAPGQVANGPAPAASEVTKSPEVPALGDVVSLGHGFRNAVDAEAGGAVRLQELPVKSDGKVIVGGAFTSPGGLGGPLPAAGNPLARLEVDGGLANKFSPTAGQPSTDLYAGALAITPGQKPAATAPVAPQGAVARSEVSADRRGGDSVARFHDSAALRDNRAQEGEERQRAVKPENTWEFATAQPEGKPAADQPLAPSLTPPAPGSDASPTLRLRLGGAAEEGLLKQLATAGDQNRNSAPTDPAGTSTANLAKQSLQEGRFLYENGRLKEAEAKLKEAVALDPKDHAAAYFLDLAQGREFAEISRHREMSSKKLGLEVANAWGKDVARSTLEDLTSLKTDTSQPATKRNVESVSELAASTVRGDSSALAPLPINLPAPVFKGTPTEPPSAPAVASPAKPSLPAVELAQKVEVFGTVAGVPLTVERYASTDLGGNIADGVEMERLKRTADKTAAPAVSDQLDAITHLGEARHTTVSDGTVAAGAKRAVQTDAAVRAYYGANEGAAVGKATKDNFGFWVRPGVGSVTTNGTGSSRGSFANRVGNETRGTYYSESLITNVLSVGYSSPTSTEAKPSLGNGTFDYAWRAQAEGLVEERQRGGQAQEAAPQPSAAQNALSWFGLGQAVSKPRKEAGKSAAPPASSDTVFYRLSASKAESDKKASPTVKNAEAKYAAEPTDNLSRITGLGTTVKPAAPAKQVKELAALKGQATVTSDPAKRGVVTLADEETIKAAAQASSNLAPSTPLVSDDLALKRDESRSARRPASGPIPEPQPEVRSADNAFSTFSLNVSDVSFKLAGASLEKGQMPDAATVRTEEFINALDYRDPEAPPGTPIAFAWERARYPFAHNRDVVRFALKTAALGRQAGRPLNLVLLLDNSGSMERADRVRIIHEALKVLATQLQPQDKISVIAFARTARLWIDGLSGDRAGQLVRRLGILNPEGGTNLEEAMDLGYATARRHYLSQGINRVVILTDGAANLGNVEPDELKQKVEQNRQQGIALDCFGIGWEGYNDDLLEVLTRNGDGRYGFVNSPEEAATEFAGQLAGALQVAASDVKVQVEFNPRRVTAYRQVGYAKHQLKKEQFRDNTVDAAEIAATETGNALYIVEVNPRGVGPLGTVRVRYKVPGTSEYHEQEWEVPFTGSSVPLEQASPALRLAVASAAFAEWLVPSPYAAEVTSDRLLACLSGVPDLYGQDPRPKRLEWMIRQAKALVGR